MVEIWDEDFEKILGKKRCSYCGKRLQLGKIFILRERKFFHEKCYRRKKAEEIRKGKVEIDELVGTNRKSLGKNISASTMGEKDN